MSMAALRSNSIRRATSDVVEDFDKCRLRAMVRPICRLQSLIETIIREILGESAADCLFDERQVVLPIVRTETCLLEEGLHLRLSCSPLA